MHRHVLVTLLKAIVLSDVIEIVPADDNGPLHLHLRDDTRQDPTSDGDISSEGAFLVYVVPSMASLGILKPRPIFLYYQGSFFLAGFSQQNLLLVLKDRRLLLVSRLHLKVRHLPGRRRKGVH